jgi:hypothetical protein
VADNLLALGHVQLAMGLAPDAVTTLQRALQIRTYQQVAPTGLAAVQLPLARALWATGAKQQARRAAGEAAAAYRAGASHHLPQLALAEQWLHSHGAPSAQTRGAP